MISNKRIFVVIILNKNRKQIKSQIAKIPIKKLFCQKAESNK
jgi:hypothetical protein